MRIGKTLPRDCSCARCNQPLIIGSSISQMQQWERGSQTSQRQRERSGPGLGDLFEPPVSWWWAQADPFRAGKDNGSLPALAVGLASWRRTSEI